VEQTGVRIREMPKVSFLIGAFEEGAHVGTATFIRETGLKEQHKGHIYGVYVTAPYRRKGIGQSVIRALLNKAKEDPSLEQVLLAVATRQEAAGQLYRRLGFEIYGIEPRALKIGSEYVDEAHMILRIRKASDGQSKKDTSIIG
jgi:ribosomal protein S18 acetylase RimI-like enzyme